MSVGSNNITSAREISTEVMNINTIKVLDMGGDDLCLSSQILNLKVPKFAQKNYSDNANISLCYKLWKIAHPS